MKSLNSALSDLAIAALRGYKYIVSPLFGSHCRFYPSCSQYAIDAIEQRGVVGGSFMALQRIVRCHPWSAGGLDPVPNAAAPSRSKDV